MLLILHKPNIASFVIYIDLMSARLTCGQTCTQPSGLQMPNGLRELSRSDQRGRIQSIFCFADTDVGASVSNCD